MRNQLPLIQSTSDDTMRVAVRQSDSTHNRIVKIFSLYRQSRIEHSAEINDILSLYCSGVKGSAKIKNNSLRLI